MMQTCETKSSKDETVDGAWFADLIEVERAVMGLEAAVRGQGEHRALQLLTQRVARLGSHHGGGSSEALQREFSRRLGQTVLESDLIRHCHTKPRGYPGDFEAMEMIWRGQTMPDTDRYLGSTPRGRFLNAFCLDSPNCRANLTRVLRLRDRLLEHDGGRVASVGCGSMIELRQALESRAELQLELQLFDQEPDALALARRAAERSRVSVTAHEGSVLRSVFKRQAKGMQVDLLYSSGLFDYFDVKQSRRVIARLWECVAPGGRLLIINGHPDNPTRPWMALASAWLLEYKTPEDMRSLVAGLPDMRGVSLERDEHGVYQYLEVLKRG